MSFGRLRHYCWTSSANFIPNRRLSVDMTPLLGKATPDTRSSRHHMCQEGLYSVRVSTGDQCRDKLRAKRMARSWSLDNAREAYCCRLSSYTLAWNEVSLVHDADPYIISATWDDVHKASYKPDSNPAQRTVSSSSDRWPVHDATSVSSTTLT